uniref:Uncharacterized protein n=1 Tax=Salix viminalis TaxID=40686 RepID=A0A6N2MEY8_SALVM
MEKSCSDKGEGKLQPRASRNSMHGISSSSLLLIIRVPIKNAKHIYDSFNNFALVIRRASIAL